MKEQPKCVRNKEEEKSPTQIYWNDLNSKLSLNSKFLYQFLSFSEKSIKIITSFLKINQFKFKNFNSNLKFSTQTVSLNGLIDIH